MSKGKRMKNINKPTLQYTPFTSGKPCYTCSDKEGNIGMGDTMENSYGAYTADKERKKIEREYFKSYLYSAQLNTGQEEPLCIEALSSDDNKWFKLMRVVLERMKQTLK